MRQGFGPSSRDIVFKVPALGSRCIELLVEQADESLYMWTMLFQQSCVARRVMKPLIAAGAGYDAYAMLFKFGSLVWLRQIAIVRQKTAAKGSLKKSV